MFSIAAMEIFFHKIRTSGISGICNFTGCGKITFFEQVYDGELCDF